jgi:NAD(P)-dependent dehydrogenase (short-subunit alcohol dehydrogenase family)
MRVWLITGAGSGIGQALARKVLESGDCAMLTARRPELLRALSEEFSDRSRICRLDVTNKVEIDQVVAQTLAHFGKLSVLVNNAGRGLVGALEEFSEEEMRNNFETNFFGPANMVRAALPHMRQQRSGLIVNISAIAGLYNEVGFSIYGAAKFALEGLSEALQSEVRHLGVKVLLVEPGPVRTGFIANSMDRAASSIADYKQSSGKFAEFLTRISGKQAGDPVRAAALIYNTAVSERPPQRLVLGAYAIKRLRDKMRRIGEELEQFENQGAAVDFDQ